MLGRQRKLHRKINRTRRHAWEFFLRLWTLSAAGGDVVSGLYPFVFVPDAVGCLSLVSCVQVGMVVRFIGPLNITFASRGAIVEQMERTITQPSVDDIVGGVAGAAASCGRWVLWTQDGRSSGRNQRRAILVQYRPT